MKLLKLHEVFEVTPKKSNKLVAATTFNYGSYTHMSTGALNCVTRREHDLVPVHIADTYLMQGKYYVEEISTNEKSEHVVTAVRLDDYGFHHPLYSPRFKFVQTQEYYAPGMCPSQIKKRDRLKRLWEQHTPTKV
mgnify:CR=1 FL=1